MNAAHPQFGPHLIKRKIRALSQKPQQFLSPGIQRRALVSAHLLGPHLARLAPASNPFDRRRLAHIKQTARRPGGHPTLNRANKPFAQIL